jgi:hypothetical protein
MRGRCLLSFVALLATAACFQGERAIKVNADGSGSIVDTLVLGAQMKALMDLNDVPADKGTDRKKLDLAAAGMGPGVRFVTQEKTADRLKTTYTFKDVSALKVDVSPGPDDDKKDQKSPQPLAFRFTHAGPNAVLTVIQPQPKPSLSADTSGALAQGMWGMMKGMLKGLKLKTTVEVTGRVARTNSRLVQGSTITLLDMDFDQITANDANFKKFTAAGDDPSVLDPKRLQGIQGISVNPDTEIVIEFVPK